MNLHAAVLPRVRRLVPSAERGTAAAVLAFVAALEVVGRQATSDWQDLIAGSALAAVVLFVVAWHRSQPLGWVGKLAAAGGRVTARLERLKYDVGVDFRGTPPLPARLPRAVPVGFAILAAWAGLAAVAWWAFPDGWREFGLRTSYVAYLVAFMGVFGLLLAAVFAGVYLPVFVLDQRMRQASGEPDPRQPDAVVVIGYFVLAALVTCVTPAAYGLGLCGLAAVALLLAAVVVPADDAAVLWRPRGADGQPGPVYSVPLRRLVAVAAAGVAVLVADLILSAAGGQLLTPPAFDVAMPVLGFLGALAAWLVPGVLLLGGYQVWLFRRTDPSRRTPADVSVEGPPAARDAAAARVREWGFRATPTRAVGSVGLRIVPDDKSEATEFDPRWPLAVSAADVDGSIVRERVARRDEIVLRRQFYRGLAALLKHAVATAPKPGGGFWVAPHWWFLESLLWEEPGAKTEAGEPDPLRPIGPPYRRALPARARQHLHQILRAAEIDLIYLEHGIGHRKLETVLRSLTELYDRHAGQRRAEETHFRGLPKVRVMIHEYAPGNPFQSDRYPEPKFDDVSRFRVLHVFKDRGEADERDDIPFDFSWEPTPLAVR